MNEAVNELEKCVEEVKKTLNALLIESGGIERMTDEDLKGMQMVFRLLNNVTNAIVKQAEIIDELKTKIAIKG